MDLTSKSLHIAFLQITPERVLNFLLPACGAMQVPGPREFEEWFLSTAETTLHGYSGNEQKLILQHIREYTGEYASERELPPFSLLVHYGEKALDYDQDSPVCRFEQVLSWRQDYLQLGQDLFTTAWLAHRMYTLGLPPASFSWPAVIPTDHAVLNEIVHSGLAENHHHLYGSAQVFAITWSQVMCYPETLQQKQGWFDEALRARSSRGTADNVWPLQRRLAYAAAFRCMLFHWLQEPQQTRERAKEYEKGLLGFHRGYFADAQALHDLKPQTAALRAMAGIRFPQPPGQRDACLDYAFTTALARELDADYRILAGERYFLYQCFLACFSHRFSPEFQWLFYSYLLLKANFRVELIQANREVGFLNFQKYQGRKGDLWQMPAYWNEACRTAVNASIHEQSLTSLETRVTPANQGREILTGLWSIDQAKQFYDGVDTSGLRFPFGEGCEAGTKDFYFVLHFPKSRDRAVPLEEGLYSAGCRHQELRRRIRRQSIELAKVLSNYEYPCRRIRGIDACANEIGCRPEVFANVFRFLRQFPTEFYRKSSLCVSQPYLSATYHVGEDFLDIADGLRAIDEAVYFLNLKRGDRLGHALALGVDPRVHYQVKGCRIVLPKQDYLDNLVWLYYRSAELNISIPLNLRHQIQTEAETLFKEIYQEPFQSPASGRTPTLRDYYCSWFLRGDSPERYKTGSLNHVWFSDFFDSFALNRSHRIKESLEKYRRDDQITALYHAYHYNMKARVLGGVTDTAKISEEYIVLMEQMQSAMQRYINDLGICIECNPSSNTLIGTFQDYGKHPVLYFNNLCLQHSPKAVQLHVSINTDDQGVFDTSLSFEYALLYAALAAMTDGNNSRLYSDREIEGYLRSLRQMGREQIFPTARHTEQLS